VLEIEKASVKVMVGESFDQTIKQAYLLYNGPPPMGVFDATKDVYEGRLMPFDELEALKNTTPRAPAEDFEDEDQ